MGCLVEPLNTGELHTDSTGIPLSKCLVGPWDNLGFLSVQYRWAGFCLGWHKFGMINNINICLLSLTAQSFVYQNNLDLNQLIVLYWRCIRSKHPTSDVPTFP